MHFVEHGYKSYPVGVSDIPLGTAVKLSSGKVVAAAAATDKIIGVVQALAKANGSIDVRLRSCAGTLCMVVGAGGGVTVNDAVTADASGLALTTTTAGNQIVGYALETVAVGGVVELMPSTAKV